LFVVSPDNSPRRGQMMGSGKFFGLRPHFLSQALLVGYFEKLICGDTSEPDPINCRPHWLDGTCLAQGHGAGAEFRATPPFSSLGSRAHEVHRFNNRMCL